MSVAVEVLRAISLFVTVVFLAYILLIVAPFVRQRPTATGDDSTFAWHIFVPARDEAAVIRRTVTVMRRDHPSAHVWVIDDDSVDDTALIVGDLVMQDDQIHIVRRHAPFARQGKGAALNAAYSELSRWLPSDVDHAKIIVGVVDADGRLANDVFSALAGPGSFGDANVGAAQIAVRMENRRDVGRAWCSRLGRPFSQLLVVLQDMEFMTSMAAMQVLRQRTGSVGLGGNGQFARLAALDAVAKEHRVPWHGALLEDYELGLHILLAGYRNRFVYDTYVEQEGLLSVRRLLAQRTRWSQGTMQCTKYLPTIVRSRHFSNAGMIEATYFVLIPWLQLLGVVIWPALAVIAGFQIAGYPGGLGSFVAQNWALAILIVVFGLGPFVLWGPLYRRLAEPTLPRGAAWLLGLANAVYQYYTYVTTLRAIARLVCGRSGWAKTRRNSERVLVGPVASDV